MLALVFAAAISVAPADDMQGLYGNTLVTVDGGIEARFYYKPDHTFTGKVPEFYFKLSGTWSQKPDGTICRVFDPPLPTVKNPDCGPIAVHAVGDKKVFENGDSQALMEGIR